MTSFDNVLDRLPTGIAGLDRILEGGLLRNGVYIAEGPPGAGKTLLATQICFAAARRGERALYTTLLAESHDRMLAHLGRMKFFDESLVPDAVYFISAFRALQQDGLPALLKLLREAIMERKASLLVLDGMVTAEEISLARNGANSELLQDAGSSQQYKQFIHELQTVCAMSGCTTLLLSSTERPRLFHPAYTMVDGILELTNELNGLNTIRHLQVRKMRGTDQVVGKHNFEIRAEGVVLHPRVETQLQGPQQQEDAPGNDSDVRMPFGIDTLDNMLAGGLPEASMTMVVGPTGTGKTLLALQFLCEGARRGERGLLFGFFERPAALANKARRLGLPFEQYVDEGLIEVLWQRPVESIIDALAEHLFNRVREGRIKRLVVDSLQGFQRSLDDYPARMRGVFAAMADELERLRVTTLYTIETREVFGPRIEVPVEGVSAVTHNIILLRHVELDSALRLMLTVLKLRDSGHDRTVRELMITDDGLQVAHGETVPERSAPTLKSHSRSSARRTQTKPTGRPDRSKKRKR